MIRALISIGRIKHIAMVMAVLLLSACNSGGGDITPPIDDAAARDQQIISMVPQFFEDQSAVQRFELFEDSLLRGRFYSETSPANGPATIRSLPAEGILTLQVEGEVFLYSVDANYSGPDEFSYQTFDGQDIRVEFNILPVNDPPALSADLPRVAEQGRAFQFQLQASDVDSTVIRFSANGLPQWLSLDTDTGLLTGEPVQSDIGFSGDVTFRVTDDEGAFSELTGVQFEVIDINDAPTLNLTQLPTELRARETIFAQVFPDDLDGDSVSLAVEENAFFQSVVLGGSISLTAADVNDVTDVNLVITATDRQGTSTREVIPLIIYPVTESGNGQTMFGSRQGNGVQLVLLGDGYAEDQQGLFL